MKNAASENWQRQAKAVMHRVNCGWWLEYFSAPLVFASLAGACVFLLWRREQAHESLWTPAAWVGGIIAVMAVGAWLQARKKFENEAQAFVRIESAMNLQSSLTAAAAGITPWISVPEKVHAGLSWNFQRILIAPLAALILLSASLFIPVKNDLPNKELKTPPPSLSQTENELNALEKDDLVNQEYIEEMRKKIDEIKKQDADDWYSHATLEAVDHMRREHVSELKKLEREMTQSAHAMGASANASEMSEAERGQLANQFEQALEGLKTGAMKPNEGLLNALKKLDPKALSELSPEQRDQLSQQLKAAAGKIGEMAGDNNGDGNWLSDLADDGSHAGDKEGEGKGENEEGGEGGTDRGPGHNENMLGKKSKDLELEKQETLPSTDLSRAKPGDLLELQDGEHELDKSASQMSQGGDAQHQGKGGDRVWRDSLDPAEQKALKKYFNQ